MTLNRNLLRQILDAAEKQATAAEPAVIQVDEYAPAVVSEHIHLAVEAGYLEAAPKRASGQAVEWHVSRLTWSGHEEFASMRRGGTTFTIQRG